MAGRVPNASHAEYYAAIVQENYQKRRIITAASACLRDVYENGSDAESLTDRCVQRFFECQVETADATSFAESMAASIERLNGYAGEFAGVPTGFMQLDDMLGGGFTPGEMIVLAARPSVGKTALALSIMDSASIIKRKSVGMFSMEMSKEQIGQRLICSRAPVNSFKFRRNILSGSERDNVMRAWEEIKDAPMYLDDRSSMSLLQIRAKLRTWSRVDPIKLVIIDYLQLMDGPGKDLFEITTRLSKGVKAIAKDFNVPVVCLSQLNRSSANEMRPPRINELRQSGSIEQDADVVLLLHRESVLHRSDPDWIAENPDQVSAAQLIVAKQRNGPCGIVPLRFIDDQTRFTNAF